MYLHVVLKMEVTLEGFFTYIAFIVFDVFVNNGVYFQGIWGFKTFSTITQKVSCLRVNSSVVPQLTWTQEAFSTIIAVEVFFSCVNALVNFEIRIDIEPFATIITSKFSFVCMVNLVVFKQVSVLKTFMTDDAHIRHGWTIILMVFQAEFWPFAAIIAAVNLFTVLPFHVSLQNSLGLEAALTDLTVHLFHYLERGGAGQFSVVPQVGEAVEWLCLPFKLELEKKLNQKVKVLQNLDHSSIINNIIPIIILKLMMI